MSISDWVRKAIIMSEFNSKDVEILQNHIKTFEDYNIVR
jgi:hypothetical protein